MTVRSAILEKFQDVAARLDKRLAPLTDETVLLDSGLDSLSFAIIVATLEDDLGVDPFTTTDDIAFPETLGAFVSLYERAAA